MHVRLRLLSSQHRLPAALLALALGLTAGCTRQDSGKAAASAAPIPVEAGQVQRQDLPLIQVSVGTLQALRSVAVKSQVDGIISEINFQEGARVHRGDPLITLDLRPFENALKIARADLANARAEQQRAESDADRYEQLRKTQDVSIELLNQYTTRRETCRATTQAKEAAVANAELQLGYAHIKSPIDGVAGQLTGREGTLVKANDNASVLVSVNQTDPIEVAYTVPERVLPQVRKALAAGAVKVRLVLPDQKEPAPVGELSFVDNSVDPNTGTILLKARFANPDASLWPGQFVQVETELGLDLHALVVPNGAVQVGQKGAQAFVILADNTVELRSIRPGRSQGGFTLIEDGLKEGEAVVTDGHLRLTPKALIVRRP